MAYLQGWILLVCAVAFTLCVGGGLCILFERWQPADPNTKKFLVGGVVASAVAAVTPQAGDLFGVLSEEADPVVIDDKENPPKDPEIDTDTGPDPESPGGDQTNGDETPDAGQSGTTIDGPSGEPRDTPTPSDPPSQPPSEDPDPPSPPEPSTDPCVTTHPPSVADPATVLGERPSLKCAAPKNYPTCVADIAARAVGETIASEAEACGAEVKNWRTNFVARTLDLKRVYEKALEDAEDDTRPGFREEPSEFRRYVLAEMRRLTGPTFLSFNEISRRSFAEMEACNTRFCKIED